MAAYLAMRIELGKLEYALVMPRYLQLKETVDTILITDGFQHLIVELGSK